MAFFKNFNRKIILASGSPRRQQLFHLLFDKFEVKVSAIDEHLKPGMTPEEIVRELAVDKAKAVADDEQNAMIFGADSVVVVDHQILGKPTTAAEATQMLQMLSGKKHEVFTGFSIVDKPTENIFTNYTVTQVHFRNLSREEIQRYIEVGNPFDKAGAYGIQDEAAVFISGITGCYYNVMGLPVSDVYQAFLKFHP